ncbi:unnamed protein product [Heligmosomoides polygyrus]|uniref:Superoxide dismutase copper/zinc binding domain-containing protein n=1 Tax=Heligmosomoides polygyrus TaxID=6339 RepID=A0A3P8DQT8_HELPZ|nr:unnamed protein product [Heligmosomoides polygyrus]
MSNRAVAVLRGDPGVTGTVWFSQDKESDPCVIKGEIKGLTPGLHGFHEGMSGGDENITEEKRSDAETSSISDKDSDDSGSSSDEDVKVGLSSSKY